MNRVAQRPCGDVAEKKNLYATENYFKNSFETFFKTILSNSRNTL